MTMPSRKQTTLIYLVCETVFVPSEGFKDNDDYLCCGIGILEDLDALNTALSNETEREGQ